jgi:glycerol uptake facilitator-like aquaporin
LSPRRSFLLVYREAFNNFDGGLRGGAKGTAGIFATHPPFLSVAGGLVDQIVGTAILILVIFALTDTATAPQRKISRRC